MQFCPRQVPHAERSRKISRIRILYSEGGAAEVVPVGIHASHGTSHSRLPRPSTRKNGRQPNRPTTVPPTSMPTAGPRDSPAITAALPKPRRLSVKRPLPKILEYAGKAIDSPIPRITRTTTHAENPCRTAVTPVAADHTKNPAAKIHFTSKRSTRQPAGICIQP